MHELSRQQARRIAVRAAGLTEPRPTTLEEAMDAVTAITLDHTPYICPSAELVLWSRLGPRFVPQEFTDALADGSLIEIRGALQRAERYALYRAEMDEWPGEEPPPYRAQQEHWMHANREAAREILEILREQGPLPPRALRVEFAVPYRSSGWNNDKSTVMMLERLADAGQVAVSRREGRQRIWDLAERVYPDVQAVPAAEAERRRNERRLAVHGVARANGPDCDPGVGEVGEEATIDGVRGRWRVDPAQLEQTGFRGRTALLSPFDPFAQDRHRLKELFDSDYALEMYKPVAKRRFGYYALPILHGDALIGTADLEADHAHGVLEIHALQQDGAWAPGVAEAVDVEIRSLAAMLELEIAETA
ncbi:MAG: DNA glycosylase AlkZ-like family protein [Brachybacterium tyrofermentans]|uniref:DNA glycosylase AlkZ-like family protein n=1 Tax=Brachybacterium tyrofermentans TaxID=47848 RepID=UPI003FBA4253